MLSSLSMSKLAPIPLILALAAPGAAVAQTDPRDPAAPLPPDISPDFLDPSGRTRFHLTTRWTPAPLGDAWSLELLGVLNLAPGIGLTISQPLGLLTADLPGVDSRFVLGNFSLGVAGGAAIRLDEGPGARPPILTLGGALDLYAPTSSNDLPGVAAAIAMQASRPIAPGMYVTSSQEILAFRGRIHAGFTLSIFDIDGELGLTPGFSTRAGSDFMMWLSGGVRVRVVPLYWLEPYLELAGSTLIVDASSVVSEGGSLLTPGVRFHVLGLSPAIFTQIKLGGDVPDTLTFGIDLAGALVPRRNDDRPTFDF